MATVKELRKAAKDAGLSGYSKANKKQLAALLAKAGVSVAAASPPKSGSPGVPTEPNKISENAEIRDRAVADAEYAAKRAGRPTNPAHPDAGTPTDAKRGGVTAKDLQIAGIKGAEWPDTPEKRKPLPPPTITGNDGAPTEAKRGGVNKLELELSGSR